MKSTNRTDVIPVKVLKLFGIQFIEGIIIIIIVNRYIRNIIVLQEPIILSNWSFFLYLCIWTSWLTSNRVYKLYEGAELWT